MSVHELLLKYLELREIPMPEIATGRKIMEEARELVEAIASGDEGNIHAEIADVVLTAAVIAHSQGVSVEDCILAKAYADAGRGGGPLPEERGEPIPDWRVPAWSTLHL
jgi:hypothetical protein